MTQNENPDANKQRNYAEHLQRVRRAGRTLDSMRLPDFDSHERLTEPPHVSHESLKDQAVSRRTRRPAEDYELRTLFSPSANAANVHAQADETVGQQTHHAPPGAETAPHNAGPQEAATRPHQFQPQQPQSYPHPPMPPAQQVPMAPAQQAPVSPAMPPDAPPQTASMRSPHQAPMEPAQRAPVSPAMPPDAPPQTVPVPPAVPQMAPPAPPTQPPLALEPADKPKTAIERNEFGAAADQPKRRATQFVAKTLLDHNAILKAQAMRQKARLEQEIAKRQAMPPKIVEPIKAQKQVKTCPFSWTDDSTTDRFKYCSKCQRTIYNFEGIEIADAEKLIFTRENLKKFKLYKRPDGKFMTSNCPEANKRTQRIVGVVAICVAIIACIAGAIIMLPPMPPPTVQSWDEPEPSTASSGEEAGSSDSQSSSSSSTSQFGTNTGNSTDSSGSFTSSDTTSSDTTQHYQEGDTLPDESPFSGLDTKQVEKSPYSNSDQKGDFWQFTD